MSRRRLTDDEHALWQGVARSVSPLRKRTRRQQISEEPETTSSAPASRVKAAAHSASKPVSRPPLAAPASKPAGPPQLTPLGRKLRKRVARGSHAIDGRLDLHGLTQAEAHDALLHFLRTRQARGARLVLVITGKGVRGDGSVGERGVLKRTVPMWLGTAEFRSYVIGFESAAVGHGGEGALYVTLRKAR
ncbi:MAG: Smr/MutS family protein [Xanthobacteraceae bacterium]|nr:Smr/MutS family protein [Xanthobacteraceae bacterium]